MSMTLSKRSEENRVSVVQAKYLSICLCVHASFLSFLSLQAGSFGVLMFKALQGKINFVVNRALHGFCQLLTWTSDLTKNKVHASIPSSCFLGH